MEGSREQVYFDRDGIVVTNRRLVIRGDTISVRAIASVDVDQLKQSHKGPMVLYGIAVFPLLAGNLFMPLVLAGGGAAWQFSQIKNPKYTLTIRTVGGEGKELTGPDGHLFGEVVAAINEVIASG